ncbi:MAG: hypothetical protein PHY94_08195 [Candidatus Omnitrophica bacterium]|nr:hypothetical protein [Candidatus Omnitrophota bacterium]
MKNLTLILITMLTFLSSAVVALAGDSVTIPISITIPAIPGVNAPPFAKEKTASAQQEIKTEAQEQAPVVIVEEKEQIQTIYTR